MKSCAYCGRDNADEATRCLECGTEFVGKAVETQASEPVDWTWAKAAFRYSGILALIMLLYLLSFGPVTHYLATVTSRVLPNSGTAITNATRITLSTDVTQTTVTYPRWIGVFYYPAMRLSGHDGSLSYLCRR